VAPNRRAQRPAHPSTFRPRDEAHDYQALSPAASLGVGERDAAHEASRSSGDPWIARMAEAQHGVVTTRQLRAAGLGRGAIAHRAAQRRLTPLHRGVYLVAPQLDVPLSREMAAVLACGAGAALSHRSAAMLWQLTGAGPLAEVEITVRGGDRRRDGIRVHRVADLDRRDLTRRARIPITTPARTLLDLAVVAEDRELARAFEQAQILRLVSAREVRAALARSPTGRGRRAMRVLLEAAAEPRFTRSRAEERMLELIRASGLPVPRTNVWVHGFEVDLHWPQQRVVAEVDGYAYHRTRAAFERDRRRDQRLQLAGQRVLRVTWRQIVDEPFALVAGLARALEATPRDT